DVSIDCIRAMFSSFLFLEKTPHVIISWSFSIQYLVLYILILLVIVPNTEKIKIAPGNINSKILSNPLLITKKIPIIKGNKLDFIDCNSPLTYEIGCNF